MNAHAKTETMKPFTSVLPQAYTLARTTPAFEDALCVAFQGEMKPPEAPQVDVSKGGITKKRRDDVFAAVAAMPGSRFKHIQFKVVDLHPFAKEQTIRNDLLLLRRDGRIRMETEGLVFPLYFPAEADQ